jgi:ubiquinone/menaquinone biosynthesis C-methylase UbiE
MKDRLNAHDLAFCGLFGAAALLFPVVFHMVRLGHVFMPMYLPLVTLAFFVPPLPAATTAVVVPLLSGAVTGMPPFYPPVAVFMSLELAAMTAIIAAVVSRRPKTNEVLLLAPVLLLGRVLYVALVYAFSRAIELPASFMAGLSLLGGWPGIVLMMAVVPPVARLRRSRHPAAAAAVRVPGAKVPGDGAAGSADPKAAYFDGIADKWDGWEDLPSLSTRIAAGLDELGVGPAETVLDAGCGTGNLTRELLARLSPAGRVVAVDFSPRMIERARRKVMDPRIRWLIADVGRLPIPDASCDRILCFSLWPHLDDRDAAAAGFGRVLKPGGFLHIWHLAPRDKINAVHTGAGEPIGRDLLPPAEETAALLSRHGFAVTGQVDDEEHYLVSAVWNGRTAAA